MNEPLPEPREDSAAFLTTAGLSSGEVADAVWLMAHIGQVDVGERPPVSVGERDSPAVQDDPRDGAPAYPGAPDAVPDDTRTKPSAGSPEMMGSDHTAGSPAAVTPTIGARPRSTPAFDATAIARVLRPLSRTSPSRRQREIDTEATAIRAAETSLWLPEFRQARARRFDVVLVVDEGGSMELWRHTVAEFHGLLQRQGAFRDVRLVRVDGDEPVPSGFTAQGEPRGSARHRLAELRAPAGGRIILVLTDGVGQAWQSGALGRWLNQWGRTESVAVVNVLRKPLWRKTWLTSHRTRLGASVPGTPNRGLRCSPLTEDIPARALPVPVLDLGARSFGRWARLVSATGPTVVDLPTLFVVPPDQRTPDQWTDDQDRDVPRGAGPTPAERVLSFRATASPTAFRLAGLLAAAPLNIEVMRLVQRTLLPASHNSDLVEVYLSGLLTRSGESVDAHPMTFDFVEGVRAELLSAGFRDDTMKVARLVSDHLEDRIPSLRDVLASPATAGVPELSAATVPYLRVEHAVMRALSGPYLRRAAQLHDALAGLPHRTEEFRDGDESTIVLSAEPEQTASVHSGTWPARGPSAVWDGVPLRNPDFTGRTELLDAVRDGFDRTSDPVVLLGMGGIGKSQVAVEYAYRNTTDYDVVWWTSAEDLNGVAESLAAMAARLGEVAEDGRRLLVFDGADDPSRLLPLVPAGPYDVLITSRNPLWTEFAHLVDTGVFTRAESLGLLMVRSPSMSAGEAGLLAEKMGDLPLAVAQAATFLAATGMPVAEYLEMFTSAVARLDAETAGGQAPTGGALTVTLDRLQDAHPAALHLLMLCSFLGEDPIPRRILRGGGEFPAPDDLVDVLRDPIRLGRAIRDIHRYALARIDHRNNTIQLHPLVRTALRLRMDDGLTRAVRAVAHRLLLGAILTGGVPSVELLSHIRASDAVGSADPRVRGLVVDLIGQLTSDGHPTAAVEFAREVVSGWTAAFGADHPDTLAAAVRSGVALHAVGEHRAAVDVHERTYRLRKDVLGPDHEETLLSGRSLGHGLRRVGEYQAAGVVYEETRRRATAVLGDDDPLTLACAGGLAAVFRLTGGHRDLRTARFLQEEILTRTRYLLGEEHPGTLATVADLALTLRLLDDGPEARRLNETAHPRLRDVLGDDHPLTLACAVNLAGDLRAAGEHAEAVVLGTATAALSARRSGDDHSATLAARLNLSLDLRSVGRDGEAEDLRADTILRYRRLLGDGHPVARAATAGTRAWFEVADATENLVLLS